MRLGYLLTISLIFMFHPLVYGGEVLYLKAEKFYTTTAEYLDKLKTFEARSTEADYYVVQLKQPHFFDLKQKLSLTGIKFLRYIPDDAFLIKANPAQVQRLQSNNLVRTMFPYLAEFKLSENFGPISIFNRGQKEQVLIRLLEPGKKRDISSQLSSQEFIRSGSNLLVAELSLERVKEISALEGVEWIEPIKVMESMVFNTGDENDEGPKPLGDYTDVTGYETGTKIMNFESFWQNGMAGQGEIIAMADSGLDSGNVNTLVKDLSNNTLEGQIFGLFADSWSDPTGHGTHVAGSLTGQGKNSNGFFKGAAYDSSLVVQSMWSPLLNTLTTPPNFADLFKPAYDLGVRIHSNSWGSGSGFGEYDANAVQVDEYVWQHPDFLILFAAGNSGADKNRDGRVDEGTISSPGTAKNALTVGASENYLFIGGKQKPYGQLRRGEEKWPVEPLASDRISNNINGVAAFSSRGPAKDGRIKPDVVAPGTNILSLCSQQVEAGPLWGYYNDHYCYSGGTSMSTPLVAGAAAVIRESLKKQFQIQNPSAAMVKAMILHSAFDMYPGQYGERPQGQELLKTAPNNHQGFGRVDLGKIAQKESFFIVEDNSQSIRENNAFEKSFESDKYQVLKVTLYYTDAPAAVAASRALVNDLDLGIYVDGELAVSPQDRVNNVEQIELFLSPGQRVKIQVKANRLPQPKNGVLPFALVASLNKNI